MLNQVAEDRTVPRNIREKISDCVNTLKDEKREKRIKINTVISILDEVTSDVNIPMYTRTQIWNIVSALEAEQQK
jgi:hypothetical protein